MRPNDPGNDRHFGGPGRDGLEDLSGRDRLYGGPGDDVCLGTDDERAFDLVNGGGGHDVWSADLLDVRVKVEERDRCYAV